MKRPISLLIISVLLMGCTATGVDIGLPEITQEAKPKTRWWWMGNAVDSTNLTQNLEALAFAGIGGVEITPIYGVKGCEDRYIDFLSPRWMNMLAFTEQEAERLGISVDMNCGTGWPFGGPDVTLDDAATKAVFHKDNSGNITLETAKSGQMVKRASPGGQGLVIDHFNRQAVEHYLARFDKAFAQSGAPFPHSFFNDSYEVYGADWSPALLDEFETRRGYRLQDYFADLLADGATETSARVISDYRETVGDMLRDNFTRVWTDWAHNHGVTVRNQAHGSPANLLDLYAMVDIPECETFGNSGFDIPGLRKDSIFRKNDGDPTVLKYASSAAHIAGKRLTSAESLTWLTEHFRTSLSQCKPEIDQMFASGVNHVVFHGTAYSPADAPFPGWKFYASIDMSPTNPFWRDAQTFFTYIARTQAILQNAKPDADFLLYLPIYDIWNEKRGNYYLPFEIHKMWDILPDFCGAVEQIMGAGYDLDYISDRFLSTCTVENGLLKTEGGTTYKALILPSVKMLPVETVRRIYDLAKGGATVIFSGQYPMDVPGLSRLDERRREFAEVMGKIKNANIPVCKLSEIFDDAKLRNGAEAESFVSVFGGKAIRQKHDDGYYYFFTMLKNRQIDGWVPLSVPAKSAAFYDAMTGKTGKARLRKNAGKTEVYMQLKPGQSLILKTFTYKKVNCDDWQYLVPAGREIELTSGWKMDFVHSEPAVNERFELSSLGSWTELPNDTLQRNMATARYTLDFEFHKTDGMEYVLQLGDVRESARVFVNNQAVATLFSVPFEVNIGKYLNDGQNTLSVEVTNLPANRIADYDRRGVEWRIFHEINFVNINYMPEKYDNWGIVPSGLLGPVVIKEMEIKN